METLKDRSHENRRERDKVRRKVLKAMGTVAIVLVVILAGLFIWNSIRTKLYTGYSEVAAFSQAVSGEAAYEYYEGNILRYSRDGIAGIGSDGTDMFNSSYEMSDPMVDTCGSFVAVCDRGKKDVYVYNGSDEGTMLEMPLPVTRIRVASQGVVAVVLEDAKSDIIALYDPYASSDKLLAEVPSNVSDDGYPVDIALSPDAKSLVTVYLSVKDGSRVSNVCFYNFSEVGQDKNRIVGGKTYQDSLCVGAEFIGEDEVCLFLDNGFSVFSNMKKPNEEATHIFDKEIRSSFYDEGYVGFVFPDSGEGMYTMEMYNESGKNILKKSIDYDYEKIYMNGGEVMLFSGTDCRIIRLNGSTKFSTTFDSALRYMIKGKEDEEYYLIDDSEITKVKLTEGK